MMPSNLARLRPIQGSILSPSVGNAALVLSLCAIGLSARLSLTFERYAILDEPRGTAVVAVGVAAALTWLCLVVARRLSTEGWTPVSAGNLTSQIQVASPKRPRGTFSLILAFCLFLRLEIFLFASRESQCSSPGVESFLCVPLLIYEVLFTRAAEAKEEDTNDPWGDVLVDITHWVTTSKVCLALGIFALSFGVYGSVSQTAQTTFFCSTIYDHGGLVVALQWLGLCLDAAIIIMLWRVLSWAKSRSARLQALVSMLGAFLALSVGGLLVSSALLLSDIRAIYLFDALGDGLLLFLTLLIASLLMCDSTPLAPFTTLLVGYGHAASLQNVGRMKTWLHGTTYQTIKPLYLLCSGYSLVLVRNHMHMLTTFLRLCIFFAMTVVVFTSLPVALVRSGKYHLDIHPLDKMIYDARIDADRWLTRASASNTLRVAVSEYRGRRHGRIPPPGYDAWYEFAQAKKSVILDHFEQIEHDMLPFWKVSPETIRAGIKHLKGQPGIATVSIRGGISTAEYTDDGSQHKADLDMLIAMISSFSQYLPDMDIPVNLFDQPRVLAMHGGALEVWASTSISERRSMERLACPAGSLVRSRQPFQVRDLTAAFCGPYTKGQFIANWGGALNTCAQPDVMYQHGFHTTRPRNHQLFLQLLPVFSRTKTGGFSDILIPLPRAGDGQTTPAAEGADDSVSFVAKEDALYWRGGYGDPSVGQQALQGNHRHRLVHLVNNASALDETVVILPQPHPSQEATANKKGGGVRFAYERVPTSQLNALLPMDVAFTTDDAPHACRGPIACAPALAEFGASEPHPTPLSRYRYILVMDTDDGPGSGPSTPEAMRSGVVPFVSTVFREWYTERVRPWVHFVPVDVRLTALHSTLAYFTGLKKKGASEMEGEGGEEWEWDGSAEGTVTLGDREVVMEAAARDARWIASQGKAWAEKALRREDMEVYLFRLLLEWARVVDDKRDGLGFVYEG